MDLICRTEAAADEAAGAMIRAAAGHFLRTVEFLARAQPWHPAARSSLGYCTSTVRSVLQVMSTRSPILT
jgi:hypothetical protein